MRRPGVCIVGAAAIAALGIAGCGSTSKPTGEKPASAATTQSQSSTASASSSESAYSYGETSKQGKPAATKTGAVAVSTASSPVYGKILVAGPEKQTVYMFSKDTGTTSSCNGTCASAWPPVISTGSPTAQSGALASKLGTITRSNAQKQVTYAGHPLYYYVADTKSGEVLGEGVVSFGAPWYMLSPAGKVIKKA